MIENIILDFGNVIYKTDVQAALAAFAKLSSKPERLLNLSDKDLDNSINSYERGCIDSVQFYKNMSEEYSMDCNYEEFCIVWNMILVKPFEYSFEAVKRLKSKYKLYLLSNTSELHTQIFIPECREIFAMFDKLYLSPEIGLRKPKLDIFQFVMDDAKITYEATLFADDLMTNLLPFEQLGGSIAQISEKFTLKILSEKMTDV